MPRDPSQGGPTDRERFLHMRDAGRDVLSYVRGRGRQDLDSDSMFARALVNALQVIGEAAARITEQGRTRAPSLPWGQIVAARHILVHVYWGIDREQVWKMAVEDVPVLMAAVELALDGWQPDATTGGAVSESPD